MISAMRGTTSESVKYPCTIVPPNGVPFANSGSRCTGLWSPVRSAKRLTSSWVTVRQDEGPKVVPTRLGRSLIATLVVFSLISLFLEGGVGGVGRSGVGRGSAVDADDDGTRGVARGAAGEQADAAAARVQGVHELGHGARPRGSLGVPVDERGTVEVHALEREARLLGEPQVVHREGVVGRHEVDLVNAETCVLEGPLGRGDGGLGHVGGLRAGEARREDLRRDAVLAELLRAVLARHDHARAAVRGVGLRPEGHDSPWLDGLEPREALRRRREDAEVLGDPVLALSLLDAHRDHVLALDRAVVREGGPVLLVAQEDQLVELLARE